MTEPIPNLPVPRGELVPVGNGAIEGDDLAALGRAVKALEHQTFAMRIANALGRQLGTIAHLIPGPVRGLVDRAAEKAIAGALEVAVGSLARTAPRDTRRLHKAAAAFSGAAGGLFGMSSLPVELPLSTVIILRSIADIARQSGEDLADPATAIACLEVFALGAHERDDTFVESGYFAVRGVLAKAVTEASKFVAQNAAVEAGSPVLVRLISQIGARFGIVVSQKIAAQAVPILGAAGGAAVNYAFAEHFQSLASAHFIVRRLERTYGKDAVKAEYERFLARETTAAYA